MNRRFQGSFGTKQQKRLLAFLLVLAAVGVLGFVLWKRGTPYQQPYWSPNGKYYVQKYSNATLFGLLPVPRGHGSDGVNGYIRLYDRNGSLIHEKFESFIRDVDPLWTRNKVYLRGIPKMDADPWILPSSSE